MSQRLKYLLIGSILVNVLLIGFIIGQTTSKWGKALPHRPQPDLLRELMTQTPEQKQQLENQIQAARHRVHHLLLRNDVPPNEFQQAVDALKSAYEKRLQLMSDELYQGTRDWPKAKREQLIRILEHGPTDGPPGKRPRPPQPPMPHEIH